MPRKSIALPFSIGLLAALVAAAFFVFGNPARTEAAPPASPQIAVALVGADAGYASTVPPLEDGGADLAATCFDVDLVDLKTNKVIGSATDCLSEITPVGGGLSIIGTTIFNFPQGELVSRGLTTVQPLVAGESPGGLVGFTHSTGAPAPLGETNILSGTGAFAKAAANETGTVRLSGLVNMNLLVSDGILKFDCMFVIDLDALSD